MATVLDPTDFVIRTRFEVRDEVPGLTRVTSHLTRIDSSVRGIASQVTGRLGAAFAGLAASYGIAQLTRGIIGINSELQNAEMGIATLFSALGRQDMATAIAGARAQVRGLREDAAKGVGELSDYVQGFQTILGPAASAGATVQEIRELNRLALTAGFALRGQEGLWLAPMDIQQALTAGAGDRTTPIVNQALRTIGVSNAQFNAMGADERVEKLVEGFKSFGPAAEAMAATWDAQVATMRDSVTDLARTATKPMFDRWVEHLQAANRWLDEHRDTLTDMADNVGQRLLNTYDKLIEKARGLAAVGAGVAGAGVAAPAAFGAASALRGVGGLAMSGAGAGAAAGGMAGAATGAGIAAAAGLYWATFVGFIAAAVTSAIARFPELGKQLGDSIDGFVTEGGRLLTAFLGLFQSPIITAMGYYLGLFADKVIDTGTVLIRALTAFIEAFGGAQNTIYALGQSAAAYLTGDRTMGQHWETLAKQQATNTAAILAERMDDLLKSPPGRRSRSKPEEPPVTPPTINNFNGPITVTVKAERLDDPNTVARSFDDVLRALQEFPLQARGGRLVPKPL